MAKKKKSLKKNGQEFQPHYQFWHEEDFWADPQVSRGMSKKQRHYYRALLQSAYYTSTRPDLPFSDSELWQLADAENEKDWTGCSKEIMAKFEAGERKINGQLVQVWKHKRLMRDWTLLLANSISHANRRKGKKKPENDSVDSLEAPENTEDEGFEGDADELLS
jgi:hypothetical protein